MTIKHFYHCFQISYNYGLSFEEIPDDLVPLTAYFKYLLTLANIQQPILLFLDSVDQLTGVQGNKLSWLPTRLLPNCKVNANAVITQLNNDSIAKESKLRKKSF